MRDTINPVLIKGTVRNGVIVTESTALPEGTRVTVEVFEEPDRVELDENGDIVMTPELEAEFAEAEAELDRGEGIPWSVVRERLGRIR